MATKTPLRYCGTIKVTSETSHLTFTGLQQAATNYSIDIQQAASTAMDLNQPQTWRMLYRIYYRAATSGSSNAIYYGSYPYVYDSGNSGNSWDRNGLYYQNGTVYTNATANGWNVSQTHYINGAQFSCGDEGATGSGNWRYNYSSNNITTSLCESDTQFEHGYIDYNFGPYNFPAAYAHSSGIRPADNSTASNAPIAISDNYGTGGTSSGGSTGQHSQITLYNGANWAPGSVFHCFAWDSKDINE